MPSTRSMLADAGPRCAACGFDVLAMTGRVESLPGIHRVAAWIALRAAGFKAHTPLWEADHIVPRAEGGETTRANLQRLCVPCHKSKTAEQARVTAYRRKLRGVRPRVREVT